MTHCFLPGAYVLIDYDKVHNRFQRAQISAAGVESNLLLAGVCLCLLKMERLDSLALLFGAMSNILMAAFNTTLINGLDGMGIYQEFLGGDKFLYKAVHLIRSRTGKAELRKRGINGRVTICACYFIVLMQMLLPIIWVMSIVNVVTLFGQ